MDLDSNVVPMSRDPRSALHSSLRTATRSDHQGVDRLIGELDLTRREDYGRLLSIHSAVLEELKPAWRPEDRDDFSAMSRRLQNDMRVLGFATAKQRSISRTPLAQDIQLGVAYVIRGSRLGAGVLRSRIPSQLPASYLDFVPALSWTQFLAQLQSISKATAGEATDPAIRGAKITFELFSRRLTPRLNQNPE
jgi:heme oxygenase